MAIYEKNGVFNYLDAEGNKNILYPVTKSDNVDGLDEELALKVNVADVVNNLTSSDTNKPLSAKQGKALQDSKQAKLVSGTNIKTINGVSILGSGDMTTPLPTASASTLGGVKIGSGINITTEGVISAQSYSLPTATASVKGGIKIGSGLSMSNEVASINLSTIANAFFPVGSCYVTSGNTNPNTILGVGTWSLLASSINVDGAVYGNGLAMGITDGNKLYSFLNSGSGYTKVATTESGTITLPASGTSAGTYSKSQYINVPTKSQIEANNLSAEATGLVTDTITCYIWKRTA